MLRRGEMLKIGILPYSFCLASMVTPWRVKAFCLRYSLMEVIWSCLGSNCVKFAICLVGGCRVDG